MMNTNFANPRALGFGVLAFAVWLGAIGHSGLVDMAGINMGLLHQAMWVAALGLLIAGIVAFARRESWLAFFFLLWSGMFWASTHAMQGGQMGGGDARFVGWFYIALTLINLYLWLATLKSTKLGHAVSVTVLLLWISTLLVGLDCFLGAWVLGRAGAAVGLAAALVAFYVSAGSLAHDHCPNMSLPGIPKADDAK